MASLYFSFLPFIMLLNNILRWKCLNNEFWRFRLSLQSPYLQHALHIKKKRIVEIKVEVGYSRKQPLVQDITVDYKVYNQ